MPSLQLPYGKDTILCEIPQERLAGVLLSELHGYRPSATEGELVDAALQSPIGSPQLCELARGKQKVVVIASDHTRPVPSRIIMPRLLAEIRRGSPLAEITLLIATGCHRNTSLEELAQKFGPEIMANEKIVVHDCDAGDMVCLGQLPSGGKLVLNRLAAEADLLVAEGFIEPHFFAGFSGGRKSVLPGVASRETVLYNHNGEFIANPNSRTGVLCENPLHRDMIFAAKAAKLAFICNVVLDSDKKIIHAVAGDCDAAHLAGCEFLAGRCGVKAVPAEIVVTTNGGYPLDQNIYQAVKGMTAAEATVKRGGVIIMAAKSEDGHGGDAFYRTFAEEKDLARMVRTFEETPKTETRVDQWQSQVFARVLRHAHVIYLSDAPDTVVQEFGMLPAHSIEEALNKARELLGNPSAMVTVIPDGVSVIVAQ